MIIVALDTHRRRSPCAIVHPETANNVLTSASPGRAAAMVPAPVEGSELPGHRQQRQILQHRQWAARVNSIAHHSRARGADDGGRRRRDASYGVARDSHPVSTIR
jgi:hypothetical protein